MRNKAVVGQGVQEAFKQAIADYHESESFQLLLISLVRKTCDDYVDAKRHNEEERLRILEKSDAIKEERWQRMEKDVEKAVKILTELSLAVNGRGLALKIMVAAVAFGGTIIAVIVGLKKIVLGE